MQSQTLKIAPAGLFTNYNQLDNVPPGSLIRAKNICIRRHGIAEPRNGMVLYNPDVTLGYVDSLFAFRNYLYASIDSSSSGLLYYDQTQAGGFTSFGEYALPPSTLTNKVRGVEANKSLFLTTNLGVRKIQTPGIVSAPTGVQKALSTLTTATPIGFTITDLSISGSIFTYTNHGLTTGMIIQLVGISGSTVPTPLISATNYYVIKLTANTFSLASSLALATAGTNIVITGVTAGSFSVNLGDNGFLATNKSVAYRMVWGYKDANGYTVLSAPSDRVIVTNTDASTNLVNLTFLIPATITTSYFYQIYRSLSVASTVSPTDELYLVAQASPSSGDITNGYFTYQDTSLDTALGATLYTSPSIEGIGQQNDQPPIASDINYLNGNMLYSNTISKYRIIITLSAITSTNTVGLQLGDTVVIDSQTYTADTTESAANLKFQLYTTGTTQQNINNTAKSLVRVINQNASTVVYGYSTNDVTGDILLEERLIGGNIWTAQCSRSNAFTPNIVTALSATNDAFVNRLYISKNGFPEYVPIANYLQIGDANKPIRRVLPLQDDIMVFKDDGIYKVTGSSIDDFIVNIFDPETIIYGENTPVVLNGAIYVHTKKGVVAVTSGNVQPLSDNVQNMLNDNIRFQTPTGSTPPFVTSNFERYCFGVAYQQNHEYILFYASGNGGPQCDAALVYNYLTNAWYQWEIEATTGVVFNNRLFTGVFSQGTAAATSLSSNVYVENKLNYNSDYADVGAVRTITFAAGLVTNIGVATSGIQAGWYFVVGNVRSRISAIVDSSNLTLATAVTVPVGSTTGAFYRPIDIDVIFFLNDGSNPGMEKQYVDSTVLLENFTVSSLDFQFITDYDNAYEGATVPFTFSDAWGSSTWGAGSWGGSGTEPRSLRLNIPRDKTRGRYLIARVHHSRCFEKPSILGIAYTQNVNMDKTVT